MDERRTGNTPLKVRPPLPEGTPRCCAEPWCARPAGHAGRCIGRIEQMTNEGSIGTGPDRNEVYCSHTPGPWAINEGDGMPVAKVSLFAVTAPCTSYVGSGLSREENLANARLIAAAPDLLATLKAITETGDDCPACDRGVLRHPENGHWPECPFGRAQEFIARAEGR